MFIPDPGPEFFQSGSRVKKIPDPGSGLKNLKILIQKLVSKLSELCSSRIRTSIFHSFRIPDPGVRKATDLASGSATLFFPKLIFM
jgi:hypothetical protein